MFFRTASPLERDAHAPCGTCQRPVTPGTSSVAFPAHHARCIERSLARARAEAASAEDD